MEREGLLGRVALGSFSLSFSQGKTCSPRAVHVPSVGGEQLGSG